MKALAERILKHPLKVIKCFHMPKLLAVEKNIFFWNRPGGDFSSMQSSRFGRGQIFCMEIKSSSVDQCVWMLISGLEPAKITLWASANVPSSQARVTSQKSLRSMRCNKEATVLAYYSSGQNESRSFQLQSLSFNTQNWETTALNSSAHCGEES